MFGNCFLIQTVHWQGQTGRAKATVFVTTTGQLIVLELSRVLVVPEISPLINIR